MKKSFLLGATLFLMASCGSGETTETSDVDSTFGVETPPEQIDNDPAFSQEEYQGSGNEADADENDKGVVMEDEEPSSKDEAKEKDK